MNSVFITGNVGQAPTIRRTKNGNVHATFSVATNRYFIDTATGERKQITKWVPVSVWGKIAEDVEKHVRKGQFLFVHGEYTAKSYDDDKGQKKYFTELSADLVGPVYGYLESKKDKEEAPNGSGGGLSQFGTPMPDPEAPPLYENEMLPF